MSCASWQRLPDSRLVEDRFTGAPRQRSRSPRCCFDSSSKSSSHRGSSCRPIGIREGLLYSTLDPSVRRLDPLIEEARMLGRRRASVRPARRPARRVDQRHLQRRSAMRRLRLASCLLADVAWQANPGFRAERAVEMALHGNWVAVDATGRVIMAQALSSDFGGERLPTAGSRSCARSSSFARAPMGRSRCASASGCPAAWARCWNAPAWRLGPACESHVRRGEEALVGDQVERRLIRLGEALGREVAVVSG